MYNQLYMFSFFPSYCLNIIVIIFSLGLHAIFGDSSTVWVLNYHLHADDSQISFLSSRSAFSIV